MEATETQSYEHGDIIALPFDSPEEEAQYIAQTAKALRGVAFKDDDAERGISCRIWQYFYEA